MRLPHNAPGDPNWPNLRKKFIQLVGRRRIAEIDLWPSQLDAATRAIDETDSLVVALPTSSGKTRIAELCILKCLSAGRRVIYVTPLRALSAQIEGTLGRTSGHWASQSPVSTEPAGSVPTMYRPWPPRTSLLQHLKSLICN